MITRFLAVLFGVLTLVGCSFPCSNWKQKESLYSKDIKLPIDGTWKFSPSSSNNCWNTFRIEKGVAHAIDHCFSNCQNFAAYINIEKVSKGKYTANDVDTDGSHEYKMGKAITIKVIDDSTLMIMPDRVRLRSVYLSDPELFKADLANKGGELAISQSDGEQQSLELCRERCDRITNSCQNQCATSGVDQIISSFGKDSMAPMRSQFCLNDCRSSLNACLNNCDRQVNHQYTAKTSGSYLNDREDREELKNMTLSATQQITDSLVQGAQTVQNARQHRLELEQQQHEDNAQRQREYNRQQTEEHRRAAYVEDQRRSEERPRVAKQEEDRSAEEARHERKRKEAETAARQKQAKLDAGKERKRKENAGTWENGSYKVTAWMSDKAWLQADVQLGVQDSRGEAAFYGQYLRLKNSSTKYKAEYATTVSRGFLAPGEEKIIHIPFDNGPNNNMRPTEYNVNIRYFVPEK